MDPPQTWDPTEYDGLTKTWFWICDVGPGRVTSKIWAPDVELWNLTLANYLELDHLQVKGDSHKRQFQKLKDATENEARMHALERQLHAARIGIDGAE